MAWIESHQDLRHHPKLFAICRALSGNPIHMIGHLHCLWWWCMDYAKNGNLSSFTDQQIADAAGWNEEPVKFVNALIISGFLERNADVTLVHDWEEYQLHYEVVRERRQRQREQVKERVKKWRISRRSNAKVTQRNAPVTQSNAPTIPNHTIPTIPTTSLGKVANNLLTDIQKVVLVYKIVSGYPREDAAWDKLNFGRCAKAAAALIEFIGNWKDAGDCIQEVYECLSAKGFKVSLEGIQKHAADWKKDKQEREAGRGIRYMQGNGNQPNESKSDFSVTGPRED